MSLRDEIFEQPGVITDLLKKRADNIKRIAEEIQLPSSIFIAARGTSDNAARYAKYVFGAINRIPVALAAPSLFSVYHSPPTLKGQLVVGISQSGESPDLISVIQEANQQGCQTLVITNQTDSPLASMSDHVIDIQAGPELAVAATKSYTAQLAAIAMLSAAWKKKSKFWDEIGLVPEQMFEVLNLESQLQIFSSRYRYMNQCVVLGRGFNYATAFEWSLKMKELSYVVAQPYSSADFQHGPIALVSHGFPVFAIAPKGAVFKDMEILLKKVKGEHRADLLLISDSKDLLSLADCPVPLLDNIPEWISPIIGIIPAQLFTYHLTIVKGMDPNAPRGLSKVTLTN
jgi:glucosamine--fructose-6-phosphate aminotransferase (isomerizing)